MKLKYIPAIIALTACSGNADFDATGSFEATEVTVSAEANGRILSFDAIEGDQLKAGQVVGAIDSMQTYLQIKQLEHQLASVESGRPDIKSQVASIKEQIAKQETERARVQNLLKDNAATQKQLDDIEANIKVLSKQLEAQLSTLNKTTSTINENAESLNWQIAQLRDKLAKCRFASPISGTVLAKYSEAGELATVGRPLMKIADTENIFLRAYFTSDQLSQIKIGQEVTVVADFGDDEQIEYPGTITWIAADSEFTPKSIQTKDSRASLVYAVKIAVKNDGRIKLGLYGEVKL